MRTMIGCLVAGALAASLPGAALAQASRKAVAPPAIQAEFAAFIARFRAALKADDAAAITGMTRLPFEHERAYPDAAQFRAKGYPAVFPPKVRACIQREKAVYDRDGEKNDNYFIFCGSNIYVFTRAPSGFQFTDVGAND